MTNQDPLEAKVERLVPISKREVLVAYKFWAPIYDWTYGKVTRSARKAALERVNRLGGRLLEVGVGTGLALTRYSSQLKVVGIDLSPHMLRQAQERLENKRPDNVIGLSQMDASSLAFADNSFDVVTAMCVMTVAPDPRAVLAELGRVVRPGGEIILVNRFSRESGVRGYVERLISPHSAKLGWRPIFPLAPFIDAPGLTLTNTHDLSPFGLFTLLCYRKDEAAAKKGVNETSKGRAQAAEGIKDDRPPRLTASPEMGGLVTSTSAENSN